MRTAMDDSTVCSAMQNDVVPVTIKGVMPTANGCAVFLGNEEKTFVIYVDHSVGNAIQMTLSGVKKDRPLTHDLIGSVLLGLGAQLDHVVVRAEEDEREEGDQVAAPVVEQQLVMGEHEEKRRHVMAEAEFAGEEEEKLAAYRVGMDLTLTDAIFARFAEDFFMGDGPGDACDREGKRKEPYELQGQRHS